MREHKTSRSPAASQPRNPMPLLLCSLILTTYLVDISRYFYTFAQIFAIMKRTTNIIISLLLALPLLLSAQQTMHIGDILCTDGSTVRPNEFPSSGKTPMGVVYHVDPTGQNCLAVNLYDNEVNIPFGGYGEDFPLPNIEESRKAIYDFNGYNNTEILRNLGSAYYYPTPWSVDFENGWYLPASGELRLLFNQIIIVNNSLAAIGATPLFEDTNNYWSSTERTPYHIHDMYINGNLGTYTKTPCNSSWVGVRSVRSFSTNSTSFPIGKIVVNDDGSKGIVFYVNPDEKAYWMVALDDAPSTYLWGDLTDSPLPNNDPEIPFHLLNDNNGFRNTETLQDYQNGNSHAVFQVDFENGWYLPSTGQLSKLYGVLPFIEDSIIMAGGSLMRSDAYWTSTECDENNAWCIDYGSPGYYGGFSIKTEKTTHAYVRAIHDFDPSALQPTVGDIITPEAICASNSLELQTPNTQHAAQQGWQIASDEDFTNYQTYNGEALDESYDGWYLRYFASNFVETVYSNTVQITVLQPPTSSLEISTCDSYTWNNETYTESGTYQQHFPMPNGCDSIVTCYLTIWPSYTNSFNITSCDFCPWNGVTYTQSGDYEQSFTSQHGCDSIITMHLTIIPSTSYEFMVNTCDTYIWNGTEYSESGDYEQSFTSSTSCDSLVILHLTIDTFEELQTIEGDVEVDSFLTPSSVYNQPGFISGSTYQWTIEPAEAGTLTPNGGFVLVNWSPEFKGTATLAVFVSNACSESENAITVNVKNTFNISENNFNAKIYPNPTSGNINIEVVGMQHITVTNTLGQTIVDQDLDTDATKLDMTQFGKGLYVIRIQTRVGSCTRRIGVE